MLTLLLAAFGLITAQPVVMPDSLALPAPQGVTTPDNCDSPVLQQMAPGAVFDPSGGYCFTVDMAHYHTAMEELDAALDEAGFDLSSRQAQIASMYTRRDPPSGCQQSLLVFVAPPADGAVRASSEPDLRPFDGSGLLVFAPVFSEGCELSRRQ
ncbi:MAG: hypothetical protein JJU26_08815 [Oceanicaulis sp.]|uniref:hypothetical protein n=1 Tax=Glycocaulis sp. TaxID=1969725 RepID=UPI0025C30405|nr:hypothetical protein [Glycocaulis sp.]MCC5981803.1 hypothetical protein [Oceanicaulis sp.]MCH8522823.1 hypothetical protein [Glycocaulis sp.]